jgi:hypothetical protein
MSPHSQTRQHILKLIAETRDLPHGLDRQHNLAELSRLLPDADVSNLVDSDYPDADILEMCLHGVPPHAQLDESQLLALARKIIFGKVESDAEMNLLIDEFNRNCKHPTGSDLIFFPDAVFGSGVEPTPEQIAAKARGG